MARYETSSHRMRWLSSEEELESKRNEKRKQLLEVIDRAAEKDGRPSCELLSMEEEEKIKAHCAAEILTIGIKLHLRRKIIGTALTYFRRFYTEHTIFEHNPHGIRLGCIYLACKVEEYFYPAEKLSKDVEVLTKAKDASASAIQKAESILLDGLKFDLVVFSPYRPLDGCTLKLQEGDVASALGLSVEQLDKDVRRKAREVVDALLLTDLQMCYPPGRIAFAALAVAISTIKGTDLLKVADILSESMELPKDLSGQDLKQSVSKIAETIQKTGCEASQYALSSEELRPLEHRRKAWRHPEMNPESSLYKHAKGRDKKKESKKAADSSKKHNNSGKEQSGKNQGERKAQAWAWYSGSAQPLEISESDLLCRVCE